MEVFSLRQSLPTTLWLVRASGLIMTAYSLTAYSLWCRSGGLQGRRDAGLLGASTTEELRKSPLYTTQVLVRRPHRLPQRQISLGRVRLWSVYGRNISCYQIL